MATLILPVRNDIAAYIFQVELDGSLYFFDFRYNTRMERWICDILDSEQSPLLSGIVMLTNFSLLAGFNDPDLPPGDLYCIDQSEKNRNPDRQSFGEDVKLVYIEAT